MAHPIKRRGKTGESWHGYCGDNEIATGWIDNEKNEDGEYEAGFDSRWHRKHAPKHTRYKSFKTKNAARRWLKRRIRGMPCGNVDQYFE